MGPPPPLLANIHTSVADPGFSPGGGANSQKPIMKMKEFGPPGGRASLAPPLDPPMHIVTILQLNIETRVPIKTSNQHSYTATFCTHIWRALRYQPALLNMHSNLSELKSPPAPTTK